MPKETRGVSLEATINDAIPDDGSFSGNVNEWARQYYVNGNMAAVDAGVIHQLREEIEDARSDAHDAVDARFNTLLNTIDGLDATVGEASGESLSAVLRRCAGMPADKRTPENPAIQHQADRADVDVSEFIDSLNERWPTDRFGNPVEFPDTDETPTPPIDK